jgi:hypothetical protein
VVVPLRPCRQPLVLPNLEQTRSPRLRLSLDGVTTVTCWSSIVLVNTHPTVNSIGSPFAPVVGSEPFAQRCPSEDNPRCRAGQACETSCIGASTRTFPCGARPAAAHKKKEHQPRSTQDRSPSHRRRKSYAPAGDEASPPRPSGPCRSVQYQALGVRVAGRCALCRCRREIRPRQVRVMRCPAAARRHGDARKRPVVDP